MKATHLVLFVIIVTGILAGRALAQHEYVATAALFVASFAWGMVGALLKVNDQKNKRIKQLEQQLLSQIWG